MRSSVDTEGGLVRHHVACAVSSVRVDIQLLQLLSTLSAYKEGCTTDCNLCTAVVILHVCYMLYSTLCPDLDNFILLSSLVSFLSCHFHLSLLSLSLFCTSLIFSSFPQAQVSVLPQQHFTWICLLAHYLYVYMYTCTTHHTCTQSAWLKYM